MKRLLLFFLVGCAGLRTPSFSERWTGQPEDEVLVRYGKPTDVVELSSGNHLDSYHSESVISSSSSSGKSRGNSASQRGSSTSKTVSCDRRFEIDKDRRVVVRAVLSGDACDDS